MQILLLSPYPPYPPRSGGALRIYNLLRGLARRHTVWCLTCAPDAAAQAALEPLHALCRLTTVIGPPPRSLLERAWSTISSPLPDMALRNISPDYTDALTQILQQQRFDIVQAESIEMADYGLLAASACDRIVLDQFNAEYVLQRRAALTEMTSLTRLFHPRALAATLYSLLQWEKLAQYERTLLGRYDHVLVVSEEDRRALYRLRLHTWHTAAACAPISIVPNGVDTGYFQRQQRQTDVARSATLVFTGTLDFRPNVDAVLWFVRAVLPLVWQDYPDVRFEIVGRSPAPAVRALHNGSTIVVQPDVADVRPFIEAAAVYVVPMRIGGGVRLKLLEALAMEAAVVSTPMGAEGVREVRDGEHLLLADDAPDFARALLRLLYDPPLRLHLGAAGRSLAAAHYEWQVIVPRLEQVYGGEQ